MSAAQRLKFHDTQKPKTIYTKTRVPHGINCNFVTIVAYCRHIKAIIRSNIKFAGFGSDIV